MSFPTIRSASYLFSRRDNTVCVCKQNPDSQIFIYKIVYRGLRYLVRVRRGGEGGEVCTIGNYICSSLWNPDFRGDNCNSDYRRDIGLVYSNSVIRGKPDSKVMMVLMDFLVLRYKGMGKKL